METYYIRIPQMKSIINTPIFKSLHCNYEKSSLKLANFQKITTLNN